MEAGRLIGALPAYEDAAKLSQPPGHQRQARPHTPMKITWDVVGPTTFLTPNPEAWADLSCPLPLHR